MGRRYKFPIMSRLACYIQWLIPMRTHAWIALSALDILDEHMQDIRHHNEDESIELFDAVSAVRLENIKRDIIRTYLKGKV